MGAVFPYRFNNNYQFSEIYSNRQTLKECLGEQLPKSCINNDKTREHYSGSNVNNDELD